MTARLPFTVLDELARYWDGQAVVHRGFELFLGSMDGFAGRLLADDRISRLGQENLQATRAAARQAREQTHERTKIGGQDRVSAAVGQQPPDAADKRRLVRYRPGEADRPDQLR